MVTTRSGRTTTASAVHRPCRDPFESSNPTTAPTTTQTSSQRPGPMTKLPVELLLQIARFAAPTPRPREIYPLAITCKGYWACLRSLLFEFDVMHTVADVNNITSSTGWVISQSETLSALSWGLVNNQSATAELAAITAISLGKLESYTSIVAYHLEILTPFPNHHPLVMTRPPSTQLNSGYLDPLSLAVVVGNTKVAKLLASFRRTVHLNRAWLDEWLGWTFYPNGTDKSDLLEFPVTPLHLAIWLQKYDIVAHLLKRLAALDDEDRSWSSTGLHVAAYLGDVKMARLMLDGEDGDGTSPWVSWIRSRLLDPRAYDPLPEARYRPVPPMLMASLGAGRPGWRSGGEGIFGVLASKGRHLVTKTYSDFPTCRGLRGTPLNVLLDSFNGHWFHTGTVDLKAAIVALIREGALEPSPRLPAVDKLANHDSNQRGCDTQNQLLSTLLHSDHSKDMDCDIEFIEQCWDAALEFHGGAADDCFLELWEKAIMGGLPEKMTKTAGISLYGNLESYIEEWDWRLCLIDTVEDKAPGFARRRPAIRKWLDNSVFQPRNDRYLTCADLPEDWSHLRA